MKNMIAQDNLNVFYSDQWDDELTVRAEPINDEHGDIVLLNFYVNDILALQVDPDKLPIMLSRNYSRSIYDWIINYMRVTYEIKREDLTRSILHDL